ncbi:MAG: tetratricopeptide repeat protein [Flavobacteriales bacterium]|nr:tetratricopeptide repeat protein [Flavobacteriales bacterium]
MRKYALIFFVITAVAVACSPSNESEAAVNVAAEEKKEVIAQLEATVEADSMRMDFNARKQLLSRYAEFSNEYREEELTPEYLFRAAKLAVEMGMSKRAIEYLTNLHDGFPKYERKVEAAFLVGFIYENMLNDRPLAQKAYEKVVELYPESPWAQDAKASINLLYLTDEQKIEKFMQQNQEENQNPS